MKIEIRYERGLNDRMYYQVYKNDQSWTSHLDKEEAKIEFDRLVRIAKGIEIEPEIIESFEL